MEKKCTKCGKIKSRELFANDKRHRDGKSSNCRKCANKATENYRNKVKYKRNNSVRMKRYNKKNPLKVQARRIYNEALRKGIIIRLPCIECGDVKSEGHHPDYSKPLNIIWLCKKHHMDLHYNR